MPTPGATLTAGPERLSVAWDYEKTQAFGNTTQIGNFAYSPANLTTGTGAGQADTIYLAVLSIPASGSATVNLLGLTDPVDGKAYALSAVKGLYVNLSSASSATSVLVGGAGSLPWTGWSSAADATVVVRNGMTWYLGLCADATGYPVGNTPNLLFTNQDASNAATVNVRIVGVSRAVMTGQMDFSNPMNSGYQPGRF